MPALDRQRSQCCRAVKAAIQLACSNMRDFLASRQGVPAAVLSQDPQAHALIIARDNLQTLAFKLGASLPAQPAGPSSTAAAAGPGVVCGACGRSQEEEGVKLRVCSGCKATRYCSVRGVRAGGSIGLLL